MALGQVADAAAEPRREEEAAGSAVLAVQDGKLSPAEPPALEAAEAAAAPLLRLSAGMEKRKAGAGDVVPPSKRFGGWSAVPAGWLQELARAGAPAAEAPMAEGGGGDAKRRVEFDAPASEAKRRGKAKGPRSKVKHKAAGAEPVADGGPRVVVDAEQEAARLREARARLAEELAARRALRAGMGRAMAWAEACRSDPWARGRLH